MTTDFTLHAGERVVFRSKRGGVAEHSGCMWLLFLFLGSQVLGSITTLVFFAGDDMPGTGSTVAMSVVTVVAAVALLVLWIRFKRGPAYFVTDRRVVARRFLRSPLEIEPRDVVGARRFLVQYTRHGRVVREVLTNRVVVALRSGAAHKVGPVEDADDFVALLLGVAQGVVDLRALPDVEGGLSRAEERADLYFALATVTAGAPRGPVFVGPTMIIGFAEPIHGARRHQMLSIVGAERSADAIEKSVLELARSSEWGRGRAVVMEREGVSLAVDKRNLVIGSGDTSVAFELAPSDAERASKFVKASQGHPYRG